MASFFSSNCYQNYDNSQYNYQDYDNSHQVYDNSQCYYQDYDNSPQVYENSQYNYQDNDNSHQVYENSQCYYQEYDNNNKYNYEDYNNESHEPSYVQSYDHTQYHGNAYQLAPAQSLVGYYYSTHNNNQPAEFLASKNANFDGDYYYDPVTTQFVVSYSTNGGAVNDLDFEEFNPEPYKGGYDINETYGKALPPSDDLCYPPTKIDLVVPSSLGDYSGFESVPSPYGKEEKNHDGEAKPASGIVATNVILEESDIDSEDLDEDEEVEDEEGEEEEEDEEGEKRGDMGGSNPTNVNIVSQVIQEESDSNSEDEEDEDEEVENVGDLGNDEARNGGENGKEIIRRQIPPGYGIEAMDLCEGFFGGYFPCLLKRNQGSYEQKVGCNSCKQRRDEYDCWQGTVDYLFGNPNPYGGAMPERGSYGDPMYCYQRQYPQQSISGQVQYGDDPSLLQASRYYYCQ